MTRNVNRVRGAMRFGTFLPTLIVALWAASQCARAGAPFVTDDAEVTDLDHFEIDLTTQYTHRRGETTGTLPSLEVDYGALPSLQLQFVVSLVYDGVSGSGMQIGHGDIQLGAKYRLIDEDKDGWGPGVAVFPLAAAVSGDSRRGLGTGHPHAFLPIWLSKDVGSWTSFGGGGYWINPGIGQKNFWYVGWGLTRKVAEALSIGAEIFHASANQTSRPGTTGFNFGGVYDVIEHHHLLFTVGRGLQNAGATNQFSTLIGYQLTF